MYSFITTAIPIYGAKVLGGDAIKNGVNVSIPWLICWITSVFAGLSATLLTKENTVSKTAIRKLYAGIVLILSPLMLLAVLMAKCNDSLAKNFMKLSVILLGFERSSIRINSLDLCPSKCYFLIALAGPFSWHPSPQSIWRQNPSQSTIRCLYPIEPQIPSFEPAWFMCYP